MSDEPREQEIAPCPMRGCGGECCKQHTLGTLSIWWVECRKCDYQSRVCDTEVEAIAAHNALCADVQRGREAAKIEQERDALRAEVERLRKALQEIADFDGVLDYKRGWDAAEVAQAALDAGEGKHDE